MRKSVPILCLVAILTVGPSAWAWELYSNNYDSIQERSIENFCCVSDYEKYPGDVESKKIPGLMVKGETIFKCPADTSITIPNPEHGAPYWCAGVGFVNYGNEIHILK